MASFVKSAKLLVSQETIIAGIAPLRQRFNPSQGRMDLMVTDSDFKTLLADDTVAHPSLSLNQNITPAMLLYGHFSAHSENSKRKKYSEAVGIVGAKLYPLVFETMGTMSNSLKSFLKKLVQEYFRNFSNTDPDAEREMRSRLLSLWSARISSVVQRANARLILSKL